MNISLRQPGLALNKSRRARALAAAIGLSLLITSHPNTASGAALCAAPFLSFDTGSFPLSVAIGDLNGDGKSDLAVANYDPGTVSVLLGNGDGTFEAKRDYSMGSGPYSVAIGDLNGDGRPDLATANVNSNTVSVLLGNGDGTFGPKSENGRGWCRDSVEIGDVNGDGKQELAVGAGA